MLFHEVYGKYYNTVAMILRTVIENGNISLKELHRVVSEHAFSESGMYIPEAIHNRWFLLNENGGTVLRHSPSWPLTLAEKRWMKAVLQDPRIRLFDLSVQGLEDVEPLFTQDMFCWFDRYGDGDPYENPVYIRNFKLLTEGILQKRKVKIFCSGEEREQIHICVPYRLEYSEKDDKFRLIGAQSNRQFTLNLSKVLRCELLEEVDEPVKFPEPQKKKLILELKTHRNTLERAMLHFSYLEKETVQLENGKYQMTLWYEPRDERELLIQILSFGPMLKVVAPAPVVWQIKHRIETQKNLRAL